MTGITTWRCIYNKRIVGQEILGDYSYYCTLGILIDSILFKLPIDEDLRCHLLCISSTVTGKDETCEFIRKILTEINDLITNKEYSQRLDALEPIIFSSQNEVTDATLVGSIDELKKNANKRKGVYKGQPGYIDITSPGLLSYTHWLAATEAKSWFEKRLHAALIKTHLREATNKSRRVSKGLSEEHNIEFRSPTTFTLFVQPMHLDLLHEIHDGTIGRFFVYYKTMDAGFHNKIITAMINRSFKVNNDDCQDSIKDIVNHFAEVVSWFHDNEKTVICNYDNPSKELALYLNDKILSFQEGLFKRLTLIDKELLSGYIRLCTQNINKLIKLDAISNKSHVRTKENINNVFHIFENSINTVVEIIRNSPSPNKIEYILVDIFTETPRLNANLLYEKVRNKTGFCRNTAIKTVKEYVTTKFLEAEPEGKSTFYKLAKTE